ncbi:MAG: toprim domain-containing protein [Patescibacteria group bacterium]
MDDIISKLSEIFIRFPGVGPKQSRRFVYFLLAQHPGTLANLSQLISELKKDVHQCEQCLRFFIPCLPAGRPTTKNQADICGLCADETKDDSLLMLVEKDIDLENIRKMGVYNGKYFVLGGLIPILAKNPAERIKEKELLKLVDQKTKANTLKEIIIALSVTRDGDNTIEYLEKLLKPYVSKSVKISILGRGLSSGTEIEYSDSDTIKNALENRH